MGCCSFEYWELKPLLLSSSLRANPWVIQRPSDIRQTDSPAGLSATLGHISLWSEDQEVKVWEGEKLRGRGRLFSSGSERLQRPKEKGSVWGGICLEMREPQRQSHREVCPNTKLLNLLNHLGICAFRGPVGLSGGILCSWYCVSTGVSLIFVFLMRENKLQNWWVLLFFWFCFILLGCSFQRIPI